jgi:biopolymer transport protein ExbB/TolQ
MECDRILGDLEFRYRSEVETASALLRLGPMLGLMGTLIPMGPALVGLAAGDLGAMATNMQVAFSTTVLGLFVGGAGFLVSLLKRRWYARDCEVLAYLFDLAQGTPAVSREGVADAKTA